MINIILADDHPIVRDGIKGIINNEENMQVTHIASDGNSALKLVIEHKPDIIISDISMPDKNGLQLCEEIVKNKEIQTQVILLSMHDNESYINKALSVGAMAYLLKDSEPSEIIFAINQVFQKKKYCSKSVSQIIVNNLLTNNSSTSEKNECLEISKREKEVIQLIFEGLSNKEIATKLFLSIRTIDAHRYNIMQKLGAKNAAELIKIAISNKIIEV